MERSEIELLGLSQKHEAKPKWDLGRLFAQDDTRTMLCQVSVETPYYDKIAELFARESPLPQKLNFASKGRRGRRPLQGENENLEIWRFVRVTPSLPAEGGGPR